ncbi:outer membrane protein [Aeoliella sp. SH292]|uniref:outer membrane protein n=1 Tax=Aeoliella sp. SH292 TaxID=3454464 RepID=UPI003F9D5EF0
MFKSLSRVWSPKLAGLLILVASCSPVQAESDDCSTGRGMYMSVFGGGGSSHIGSIDQMGTAYFTEAEGGPMAVNALGSSGNDGVGLVGLNIGHEWSSGAPEGCWGLLPAVELEAMYLSGTPSGQLTNDTVRLPEHLFEDSFPMDNIAVLGNGVVSFQTPLANFYPYVGLGLGFTNVKINGATSTQLDPAEPGVNHFNSNPNSSALGLSAQFKAGFRFNLTERMYLFTEYRYLYVGSTTHTFGSTNYPTHAATSPWAVQLKDMNYHLAVGGIGFDF